jgi:glycerophosphoryl diester phosphodiesterase
MGSDKTLLQAKRLAPHIKRCVGGSKLPEKSWAIVDRAIEMGCEKVQLLKPYLSKEMCDKAHAHNIRCNVFWSDDPEETVKFLDMGVDVILTNDYNRISQVVENYKSNMNK